MEPTDNQDINLQKGGRQLWQLMAILLLIAVLLVIANSWARGALGVGLNLLLGICAGSVSGIVGFLFGIPHTPPTTATATYRPSTNLEQVSDWLTKIIIGVGLVESDEIANRLAVTGRLIGDIAPKQGAVMPQIIIVVFAALGFFAAYIWTRLYYGGMQTQADSSIQEMLAARVVKLEGRQQTAEQTISEEQVKTEKLVSKTDDLTKQTAQIDQTTVLLAKGEIGTATPPAPPDNTEASAEADLKPLNDHLSAAMGVAPGAVPTNLQQRVQQFMAAPVDFDTDPAAESFKGLTLNETNGGLQLRVSILTTLSKALTLHAVVARTDGRLLDKPVVLLLHPTYRERMVHLQPKNGQASYKFIAAEWFTLVAIADGGKILLSYDLRNVPNAPDWFKKPSQLVEKTP